MEVAKIAPGLLLAMPQLLDPNFRKTVVLMVEHHDQGSLGLIVNRPGLIPVAALMQGFDLEWEGDPDAVVGFGGPVSTATGFILHTPLEPSADAPEGGTVELLDGIALSTSVDALRRVAARPPDRVRFLMGYAGWGAEQLAAELAQGAWLHAQASASLVFDTPADQMWEVALRSIGVDPCAVIPGAGIH